jgi:type I restriction enzyme S subunit
VTLAEWRDCKLGDLLQIKHGFAFLGEHFANSGTHVVLTPGNFLEEGGFKEKSEKAKWYNGPIPSDYVLNEGDLIVAMTEQGEGLLGSSAIIPRSGVYLHNQRLGLVQIRDRTQADQHFIYYLFNSKPVRQQIRGSASGAKIRHTAPSRIAEVKVSVPPFPEQQRIAGILSAYDELMENSLRRIRILEEMARALYREWFVHFRPPGHEKVQGIASPLGDIPKGWEVAPLSSLVDFAKGRKPAETRQEPLPGDVKLLLIDSLHGGEAVFTSPANLVLAETRDTIMVMDGASSCEVTIGSFGAVGSTLGRFRTTRPDAFSPHALYRFLEAKADEFKSRNIGAAIPHANRDFILTQPVALPQKTVTSNFHAQLEPIQGTIETLKAKIQNLRRTRDLLLPRLLLGQIAFKS